MNKRWEKWDEFMGPIVDEIIEEDWIQQDKVDNAVYNMLCELADQTIPWNTEIIHAVMDYARKLLWEGYKIRVPYPEVEVRE